MEGPFSTADLPTNDVPEEHYNVRLLSCSSTHREKVHCPHIRKQSREPDPVNKPAFQEKQGQVTMCGEIWVN
jgi:hypothetical protein